MIKVAVLGANGQVGAELCLLLSAVPGLELVPVCRNRSGSAFLRWHGIACRHGRISVPDEALKLIGDCDVVVNSALARGSPRSIRTTEDSIIGAMFTGSKPGAVLLHFSTQSVYGDARPGSAIRWRSQYGRYKLATERMARRLARRYGKPTYILRLGHVCGPLQQISADIRDEILRREVVLPIQDRSSNTVYTSTIRDAILLAMSGDVAPGTYDLMNQPQWTWQQVYEHEAAELGVPLSVERAAIPTRTPIGRRLIQVTRGRIGRLAKNLWMRQLVASTVAHMPERVSSRAQATWYAQRAREQIASFTKPLVMAEHLYWVANGNQFLPGLPDTIGCINSGVYTGFPKAAVGIWSPDLPLALM